MHNLNDVLVKMFGQEFADAPVPAEPIYQCVDCLDRGYIRYDVPFGDDRFGKQFRCPNPNCPTVLRMFQEQSEKLMQFCTWEDSYSRWTFESYYNLVEAIGQGNKWDGKRGAYAATWAFVNAGGNPFTLNEAAKATWKVDWIGLKEERLSTSVVLTGDVGLGKTGLAIAAVNELRARCQSVVFIRVQELIRRLQETYDKDATQSTDTRSRFYSNVPYLIIDEFGMKNYSNDRLELVENIIRERDRKGLPFMATTNLNKDEFYDCWRPQIADIVAKSHWVQIGGVKLRQTAKNTEAW